MAEIVYTLCLIASLACSALLFRNYGRTRLRLILWTSLCFSALALNNLFMLVDLLIGTVTDLSTLRLVTVVVAAAILLYGMITEVT